MSKTKSIASLGDFEELVLLAVVALRENAYGVTIKGAIESAGRVASFGSIYVTLERLEEKRYINGHQSEARGGRGGKSVRLYGLTEQGHIVLNESEARRERLRNLKTS